MAYVILEFTGLIRLKSLIKMAVYYSFKKKSIIRRGGKNKRAKTFICKRALRIKRAPTVSRKSNLLIVIIFHSELVIYRDVL